MRLKPSDLMHELRNIDDLRPHPENPNNGDTDTISKSIKRHGVFRAVVVSIDDYILAGNHTVAEAIKANETQIWVTKLPIKHDGQQAMEIMLIDNESHKGSRYDDGQLAKVLEELPTLEGTGFSDEDLAKLLEKIDAEFSPLDDRDVCDMCGARLNR